MAPAEVTNIAAGASGGLTVHVVGRVTPPLASFVQPAIEAMAALGVPQALVFIDDEQGRTLAEALHPAVVRVPVADGATPWSRARSLTAGLRSVLAMAPSPGALHLHGLLPGLAALRSLPRGLQRTVPVWFSPHSSRAQVRPVAWRAVLGRLLRQGLGPGARQAIVNLRLEPEQAEPFGPLELRLVECPVPQVFFDTPRREAQRPLLIGCHLEGQRPAVDGFLRVAVLLNDERLGLSFNWVGPAEPEVAEAIRASGIGRFDAPNDAARALRMSAAWVFVAATCERGFPLRLAEAMAAGLPCVALDSEVHRSMIIDGQTGFLCADLQQLLLRVGQLVDSPALRQQVGQAARREATRRFSEAEFRRQLWRAIGPARAPADDDAPLDDTMEAPLSAASGGSPPWR